MPAVVQGSSQGGASFQACLYSPRPVRSRGEAERGGLPEAGSRLQQVSQRPWSLPTSMPQFPHLGDGWQEGKRRRRN